MNNYINKLFLFFYLFKLRKVLLVSYSHQLVLSLIHIYCELSTSFHRRWPGTVMADTDRCCSVGQEALSVVSEDQPIFEPPYPAAPTMHMKAEMTSPGGFSHSSKQSPEPSEPEWVGSAVQNPGKRGEHVNGTRWVRAGSQTAFRVFPDPKIFAYCSFTDSDQVIINHHAGWKYFQI